MSGLICHTHLIFKAETALYRKSCNNIHLIFKAEKMKGIGFDKSMKEHGLIQELKILNKLKDYQKSNLNFIYSNIF